MRVGIIGLGDIAKKAYLPVLSSREDIELVICTRNRENLESISKKYRINEYVQNIEDLVNKNVDGVFVSTATEAHFEVAKKLLKAGINVYIDKPISMNFSETEEIVTLAEKNNKIAMVGFNRRFSPMFKNLKDNGNADIILIQKNRFCLPDSTRRFIVEDFVHVVDTLRFLMDKEIEDINVKYLRKDGLLHNVVLQLSGNGCTAIGIMNRNNGATEEIVEYMTAGNKYIVDNFVETWHLHDKTKSLSKFGDWEPTLYKRGFYQIVDHFIDCLKNNRTPNPSIKDSLITHEICEKIVMKIENV